MKRLILPLAALLAVACNSGSDDAASTTTSTGGGSTTTSAPGTTGTTGAGKTAATTAANAPAGGATGFTAVAAVATNQCMPCHSAEKHAGGLSLASYDALMKGGQHGSPVKAGDPDHSLLVQVLKGPVDNPHVPMMPMKRAPLSAADIQKISDWIKAGAKNA